jgi:BirA family biotin operon repressor/biotin-[acetyl-CoA-carboxylase] ligase
MNKIVPFNPVRFEQLATERRLSLGRPLIFHATTTSTNDVAIRLCHGGTPHGLVVVADHQTAGRGRRGKTWYSPNPGENLLFSLILRLEHESEMPSNITLAIGLALRDAIQPIVREEIRIKWANDILISDKKIAGILVESQLQAGNVPTFIVGIGLNVQMRELPEPVVSLATSLALLNARVTDREVLLADILQSIDTRIQTWQSHGFAAMALDLRQCDALLGRRVSVDGVTGRALGIDDTGALMFRADNEPKPRRVLNGTVDILD